MKTGFSCLPLLLISLLIIIPAQGQGGPVGSSEILTLIENGETVDYSNKVIEGNLIFGKISDKNNTINSEIKLMNCTIMGLVDFSNTTFKKPVNLQTNKFNGKIRANHLTQFNNNAIFSGSKFNDNVSFGGATFKNTSSFANSNFTGQADFRSVKFEADANFRKCRFNGISYFDNSKFSMDSSFREAKFYGITSFNGANFSGDTIFRDAKFYGITTSFIASSFKKDANFLNLISSNYISFENAKFDGMAEFSIAEFNYSRWINSIFKGSANFNEAKFKNTPLFRETNFERSANFEMAQFRADATFKYSTFNKTVSFEAAQFFGDAAFSNIKFKENANFKRVKFYGVSNDFDFTESQLIGDLYLEDVNITGNIFLTKTKYSKIYVRWENIHDKLIYDDAAYMALLENFKKLGMLEDADSCYYEYRKERRDQSWTLTTQTGVLGKLDESFRKTIDYFLDKLYAYGIDPLRPIAYSLVVIFICTFLWRAAGMGKTPNSNGKRIHKGKMLILKEEILYLKEPLVFSILVFISAAKFLVETTMPQIPQAIEKTTPWSKYLFSIERILAGLLLALFFLAVSRTIVRNA